MPASDTTTGHIWTHLQGAAGHLSTSPTTLRQMVADCGLPHLHRGRTGWLFRLDLLEDALEDVMTGDWTPVDCHAGQCGMTGLRAVS